MARRVVGSDAARRKVKGQQVVLISRVGEETNGDLPDDPRERVSENSVSHGGGLGERSRFRRDSRDELRVFEVGRRAGWNEDSNGQDVRRAGRTRADRRTGCRCLREVK